MEEEPEHFAFHYEPSNDELDFSVIEGSKIYEEFLAPDKSMRFDRKTIEHILALAVVSGIAHARNFGKESH